MSKILVTGGAGFIGSHLVDRLVEEGHKILVIDNLCSGSKENLPGGIQFMEANLVDFDKVVSVVSGFKPDCIYHLAAVSRTPWAIESPLEAYATNVFGSASVLEAAARLSVKKVVLASSNIVYAAQTPYKSSKLAMEMVARDYNDLYGLPTLCLRFSNVYGAVDGVPLRQHPDNVLASLSKSKKENGFITITGDGKQTRNFTHVSDICDALITAMNSDVRGDEIDIMHPKLWELNEVAKMYDCPIKYIEDRKGDIKHLKMTGNQKAKELLNWEAKRNLEDNIKVYTE